MARDRKDWKVAARAYEQHLSRHPDDAAIWIQLGHACKELDRLSAAEIAYQRALFLRPHDADLFVQIGHLHKLAGDPPAAISAYRRALELDPASGAARTALDAFEFSHADCGNDRLATLERELKRLSGRIALLEQTQSEQRNGSERLQGLRKESDAH